MNINIVLPTQRTGILMFKWILAIFVSLFLSACGGGGGGEAGSPVLGGGAASTLFTSASDSIKIKVGKSDLPISIAGGKSPYTVRSDDPSVLSVSLSLDATNFIIEGLKLGGGSIIVKDSLGSEVRIAVTVVPSSQMTITPLAASGIVGDVIKFDIRGGEPDYKAGSGNLSILGAPVFSSITSFSVKLTAPGATVVTVADAQGQIQSIAVNSVVSPIFISAPAALNLNLGESEKYTVGGGSGIYDFKSSQPAVVVAEKYSPNQFKLTAVGVGGAKVWALDSTGNRSTIDVIVAESKSLTLSSGTAGVTASLGGGEISYSVIGGRKPYKADTTNKIVLSVADMKDTPNIVLTPKAIGSSTVVVTDDAGTQIFLPVTVVQSGGSVPLRISPAFGSGAVGDTLSFTVTGGSTVYTYRTSNNSLAEVDAVASGQSYVQVRLQEVGSATLTVIDNAGQLQEATITSTPSVSPTLRLSPISLQISEVYVMGSQGSSSNIIFNVAGGIGPFSAYTTDPQRAAVAVNGSQILVFSPGGISNLCSDAQVTKYALASTGVNDSTQPATQAFDLLVTVVDSKGARATGKLVIIDDGNNFPGPTCR